MLEASAFLANQHIITIKNPDSVQVIGIFFMIINLIKEG
jgi:hypothetical protein